MTVRDIWVDFNSVDLDTGWVDTLAFFAQPDVTLEVGQAVIAGDADANICDGMVLDIAPNGVVKLSLKLDTMRTGVLPTDRVESAHC